MTKRHMKKLSPTDQSGFTRVDLMVIIVVLSLLVVVCIPAFGRAGMNSKGLRCLYNVRQLANAWRMYADDNRDRMVYASTDGGSGRSGDSVPMTSNPQDLNNYAWSGTHLDFQGGIAGRANWDINYDLNRRPLWPYVGRDALVYKCPEDQSAVPNTSGTMVPRVLSMSMNTYLGGFAGTSGGWDSVISWFPRIFLKTAEFTPITPAKVFVFTDQRSDAINWSNFMVSMAGYSPSNPALYQLSDFPGLFHDGGAAFSFADGHGELHRWQDPRTIPPLDPNGSTFSPNPATPNNPDIAWLQDHASRPR
jgi:prepilin-type processing-associated H-X9-DG protein